MDDRHLTYPTIATARAWEEVQQRPLDDLDALRRASSIKHPHVEPPLYGTAVSVERLEQVVETVRSIADAAGFPAPLSDAAKTGFDRELGAAVHDTMLITPASAAHPGTWNYLSGLALTEVAVWRFPSRDSSRILGEKAQPGGPRRRGRNTLGRLWWAVEVLGDLARQIESDDWGAPLGEDEIVGIMERASAIAPSPTAARALGRIGRRYYAEHAEILLERTGEGGRMMFFRALFKHIPRLRASTNISALTETEVEALVLEACEQVAAGRV